MRDAVIHSNAWHTPALCLGVVPRFAQGPNAGQSAKSCTQVGFLELEYKNVCGSSQKLNSFFQEAKPGTKGLQNPYGRSRASPKNQKIPPTGGGSLLPLPAPHQPYRSHPQDFTDQKRRDDRSQVLLTVLPGAGTVCDDGLTKDCTQGKY